MFCKKLQAFAQVVGVVTIGLLAVYGLLAVLNGGTPVWAVGRSADVAPARVEASQAAVAMTVPGVMNYQGYLRDSEGSLLNGYYTMTFAIYTTALGGTPLWSEDHISVTVRDGFFNEVLGNAEPVPAGLFTDPDRYIGVTVAPYAEMVPPQRFASVPYAFQANNGVPVGAVIDWWRPDASFPVPEHYMICDGSTVTDTESPLYGETLPDLNERFVRGVTDVGQIGITAVPTHNHTINHDHDLITTSVAGNHAHMWAHFLFVPLPMPMSWKWYSWNDAGESFVINSTVDGLGADGSGVFPLSWDSLEPMSFWTKSAGDHSHSVDVPAYAGTSGEATVEPPYVGLLKLCRIR
jgi:hypothetical protein